MKGTVYKIICLENPNIIYIGSTITTLSRRMSKHRSGFKTWISEKKGCVSIYPYFQELGIDKFKIVELERYEVEDKQQLFKYEQEWIDKTECVNKHRSYLSDDERKEYYKEYKKLNIDNIKFYYENNKDLILERQKSYYEKNKEIILEKNKSYYEENRNDILEKKKFYHKQKVNCTNCNKEMSRNSLYKHNKRYCKAMKAVS